MSSPSTAGAAFLHQRDDQEWADLYHAKNDNTTCTLKYRTSSESDGRVAYHVVRTTVTKMKNPQWHGRSHVVLGIRGLGDTRDKEYINARQSTEATLWRNADDPPPSLIDVEKAIDSCR